MRNRFYKDGQGYSGTLYLKYAKARLSAKKEKTHPKAWLPQPHENHGRTQGAQAETLNRPKEIDYLRHMLSKLNRLPSLDIRTILRKGKRIQGPVLQLVYAKNNLLISRFAFIVSTNVDKRATARNRMKRLLRESVHHKLGKIQAGWDVAFFVRKNISELAQAEVEKMMTILLNQAGLLVIPLHPVSSPTRSGIHSDGFPPARE